MRWRSGRCRTAPRSSSAAATDGTVRVWRLADGTPVGQPLPGHDGAVYAVAAGALPDGTPVIVSGGYDGTVRVWRLADGTPVGQPLRGHDGWVNAVAVGALPDGTPVIISGGSEHGAGVAAGRRHPGRGAADRPHCAVTGGGGRGAAGRHPGHHQRRRATARCGCGGWPTAPRSGSRCTATPAR